MEVEEIMDWEVEVVGIGVWNCGAPQNCKKVAFLRKPNSPKIGIGDQKKLKKKIVA